MTTEIHEGANGILKKADVEPLGELKGKEELQKPVDLCSAGDVNGKIVKSGDESLAEKEEILTKNVTPKQKGILDDGTEEDGNEPHDDNEYSSDEEEGEGDENVREVDGEPYEEEDEEEYVDDGEDDEGEDDDESEPPSKRRK